MPKVNIPRVGVVEFPDSMTQEQILQAIETDIIPNYQRPDYGVLESGIRGVRRGFSRMGSLATDIVPALVGSALGFDEYAQRQLKEAEEKEAQLRKENAPGFTSFKQIEGPLDFFKFGAETIGEAVPDVVGAVGTGGIGGLLGKRAAVKGAEELAERIAQKEARSKVLPGGVSAERLGELEATAARRLAPQIKQAQATGQAAGVYLGSYALNTPDVFQSIYEQTGELAPGAATLFGGAVAALDAVLPKQLLDSMSRTEKLSIAEKILEKSGMQPSLLRKATALIPTTAAKEGITEGTQELITAAAEKFVDENQDLWSSENFNRYLESAVRGSVAGGGFGAVQAGAERLSERGKVAREQRAEEEKQFEEAQRQERIARGEAEQPPLFPPGEITPPSPGLTFPSASVEEKEPETARTKYKDSKEMRKSMLGLRPEPYEVTPSGVVNSALVSIYKDPAYQEFIDGLNKKYANFGAEKNPNYQLEKQDYINQRLPEVIKQTTAPEGQMELFEPEAKGKKQLQPTPEADVQALAKKLEEEQKKKIAEGKAAAQALKEAIAELSPKEIDLLDYARRTGITSTPLFQLVQQATELPQPKVGKAPKQKAEKPTAEPAPAAPATLLTAEKLKGVGLSPLSGFYRRLVGKDVLADETLVRAEIEKAKLNPNISASTIKGLEALETELPLQLTQPEVPKEVKEEPVTETPETLDVTPEGQGQLFSRVGRDFRGMPKEELEANAPVFAEQLRNELKTGVADKAEVLDKVRGLFDALDDADLLTQDERRAFYEIDKTLPITQTQKPGVKRSNEMMYLDLINMLNLEREKVDAVGVGRPRARARADIKEELEQYQEPEAAAAEDAFTEEGEQEVVEDPKDVWDKLTAGMGVPYDSLNADGKDMWAGAVEGGYANLRVANELFTNFGAAEAPTAETPIEEELEKPEVKEVSSNAKIRAFVEENTTPEERQLITEDKQLGNGDFDKGVEKLKKYVAQSLVGKLQANIKKAVRDLVEKLKQGMMAFVVAVNFTPQVPVDLVVMPEARAETYVYAKRVDNSNQAVGEMAERVANFALNEGNGSPFMVVDKQNATLYAYDSQGKLLDKTVVLLGKTVGDVRPTIGKPLAKIKDEERITPAGKFTGKFRTDKMYGSVVTLAETQEGGVGVVAVHRMYLGNPNERRMGRFNTPDAKDNRIGMGCLNVPDAFYDNVVEPNYKVNSQIFVMPDLEDAVDYFGIKDKNISISGGKFGVKEVKRKPEVVGREEKPLFKEEKPEKVTKPTETVEVADTVEPSGIEKAKARVGEELQKLVSSIGATHNLTPEEQGSLSNFMSALGDLMYELVKSGAMTFAAALPIAKRRARKELGDVARYVPESAYKQAYDAVKSGSVNPKQQRSKLETQFNNVVNRPYKDLPEATQKLTNDALNALSNLPTSLRQAALGFLSLDQINDLYGKIMPSIKKLIKALEVRASDVAKRREFVEKSIKKYHEVFKNYTPEQKKAFFKTFFETTLEQIEPLTITVKEVIDSNGQVRRQRTYSLNKNLMTANNPIAQRFHAMPEEVRQVYLDMRRDYDNYADELENLITKDVTPGTAKKLRTQFELRRLKVYLPLFRQGNYWLSYTDESGEPIVMAFESNRERELEIQRAKKEKVKDIKEFSRFEDIISRTGRPPVGFVAGIIKTLQDEKVPKAVLDQVYSSYLSLFPAESVRQMYRKRKGIEGFEKDAVEVYANVMSRMINQVGNLSHAKDIDTAMGEIITQGDKEGTAEARDVVSNIAAQNDYMMNPVPNKISARLSSFSYYMYIAGNVSSAIVNLTQLPIVVYSLLGGEYGFDNAYDAMKKATSMYLNGAKDDNATFLPDWTFGKGKNVRSDLKRLYDEAVKQSVIRRSTSHEIVDMRKQSAGDYVGLRAKVETGLAWVFQNSERANREITLIAAYELARKKGLSEQAAIEKAMSVVKMSHGASLSETGPRFFQNNIGRVIFTFKRFAQSQIYLLSKLFNEAFRDADPKVRDVARKQLMGIYGMAFMFAGAQGVPLYGAGSMLVGFLMGDDDEPVDLDEYIRASVNDMVYKGPVNQLLNVDIASRTGFNSLVWRDNPRRLAEVGPVTYMFEQMAGPSYSAFLSMQNGYGDISEGNGYRGLEAIMPSFLRNTMKGFRFAIDGATNRDGVPIEDDINAYNIVMQIAGFTPADLSEAYARAGAKKEIEKKILQRRTSLLDKLYTARKEGDLDGVAEIREQIADFNSKNPEKNVRITGDTISRSMRGHQQREKEMVDGVRITPALRRRLEEEYGADDDDDDDDDD